MRKNNLSAMDMIKKYNLVVLLLIFIIIATCLSPKFLRVGNFLNLLQQCSISGIIAIGMTLVILTGGIDLSVGAVAAASGMVCAIVIDKGLPFIVGILAGLMVGLICGLITGTLVARFQLPNFIASLAMMESARGFALLSTDGVPVYGLKGAFRFIGGGFIGKVSVSGLIWILLTVIVWFVLKYTEFGRSLFAIGGNIEAANLSGIKTVKNCTIAYILCALCSAFAGILTASWLATGQPTACDGAELDAIAASVIGGASLTGGVGTVIGTFGGVFLLQVITNIFNLVGLASYYQQIAKGLIIVAALLLNKFIATEKTK